MSTGDPSALVSVILPVYNMAEYVGPAIESVLAQDYEAFELLVVDDGSTDGTEDIVAPYADPSRPEYDERVRYVSQPNQGKASAVNHGLNLSTGAYITILDADDKLPSGSLSLRYTALEGDEATKGLAIGGFEVFDSEGKTVGGRPVLRVSDPESLYRNFFFYYKSPFHLNACLFPRELHERVGPFDNRLHRCQDIDYSIRLLKAANQVTWVHEPVYQYRKHRSEYTERVRIRRETLTHRSLVYWKNYQGWRRYVAVLAGVALDAGKFFYEMTGNYQN